MKVTRADFDAAAAQESIDPAVRDRLWSSLEARAGARPGFNFATVASYFGAMIVISAMGWFMTLGWEEFGGWGIFAIASLYAFGFVMAGRWLWRREGMRVPGGLLFTMAVCMTPLIVYGLEKGTGLWVEGEPGSFRDYHVWVKGCWLAMELSTIAAALLTLKWIRFPFLVAPIAFTLWYMSMDVTPLLFGKDEFNWEQRQLVSAVFGFVVLLVAYAVDRLMKDDFAFWLYLFGLMAFWGGLSFMESDSEIRKALYCLLNLMLMALSVILRRRAFAVFGALGITGYLGYLSSRIFKDSILFPFVLTAIGLGFIGMAVLYQRRRAEVEAALLRALPAGVRALQPPARD